MDDTPDIQDIATALEYLRLLRGDAADIQAAGALNRPRWLREMARGEAAWEAAWAAAERSHMAGKNGKCPRCGKAHMGKCK